MIIVVFVLILAYILLIPKGFIFRSSKDIQAVNTSGSLRMLTKRAMKARLMALADVKNSSAQNELQSSLALFDARVASLRSYCKSPELKYLLDRVSRNWELHKVKLINYPGSAGIMHVFRENNDMLDICDDLVTGIQDKSNKKLARLVNLAGRQRMLSQRIAKNCIAIHIGLDQEKRRDELSRSIMLFNIAVAKLKDETRYRPIIALQLEQAANRWERSGLPKRVNQVEKGKTKEDIILSLINKLNEITALYDDILSKC